MIWNEFGSNIKLTIKYNIQKEKANRLPEAPAPPTPARRARAPTTVRTRRISSATSFDKPDKQIHIIIK